MKHWRCKCGSTEWFGSDAPATCNVCKDCGTNAYRTEPPPHEPQRDQSIRDGVVIRDRTYCKRCHTQITKVV